MQVAFSRDPAARAAFYGQAAEDWRNFLTSRSRELRPGGRLVVLTMALEDNGNFGYGPCVTAIYDALLEQARTGLVRMDEVHRMVIPTIGRSRADLMAPFSKDGRFEGLTVEHLDVFLADDNIWNEFERDHNAAEFGKRWTAFSRASVFPTLALGLDGGLRDPRAAAFMDKLEAGMSARLAAAPQRMDIPLARMTLV